MPISPTDIQFRDNSNNILTSGQLNNLFTNARADASTDYAWLQIENRHPSLTLSSVVAWLSVDSKGATVAIAYDSTNGVISTATAFSSVDISSLSYSTPTSRAGGISLGTMATETQCRIGVRRVFSSATAASPENNRVYVGGTSPL